MTAPLLAALAALLAADGPASARDDAPEAPPPAGLYGIARGGVLLPRGSFAARGRGSGEVALGWLFGRHLAAEVAVAFYGATGTTTVVTGAGAVSLPVDYELLPVAASLRVGWRLGPVEPYVAPGAGLWQVRAIVAGGGPGSRTTQPGVQAALGVDLALGGGFAADVQGRYLATFARRSADPEVRAVAVFGGVGYRF